MRPHAFGRTNDRVGKKGTSMEWLRKWFDFSWRGMPGWLRFLIIVVMAVVASSISQALRGRLGFGLRLLLVLALALIIGLVISFVWRITHTTPGD